MQAALLVSLCYSEKIVSGAEAEESCDIVGLIPLNVMKVWCERSRIFFSLMASITCCLMDNNHHCGTSPSDPSDFLLTHTAPTHTVA